MAWCEECRTYLTNYDDQHCFAGYGWFFCYCEKCCPRVMDGSDCGKEHNNEEETKDASSVEG